jgi:glycosyltransferase involved in cell wall biosynthesis
MPRVLILCEFLTMLGGERSMLSTLPAIRAAGFDVHGAVPPVGALADALREIDVPVEAWSTHDAAGVRRSGADIRADLAALIARLAPDLVHANSLSTSRLAGPVMAATDVASLGHFRDIMKLSQQAIEDLNCLDRLVAVSQAVRMFHVGQGIDAAKWVVANNGIDLDTFRPRAATGYLHRELGLSPNARLLATIGQVGMRKGTDVALEAATRWAAAFDDVHWLIVGERTSRKGEAHELEAKLCARATEVPLAGRVHFLGTRTDVSRLMPECSLLVHAALQEPFGRVLQESAACGLGVVATEVGGTREMFPGEADGAVLVPARDAKAIADAVVSLLGDERRLAALGVAGRRRAEAAFDIRMAAARLIDVYHSVLGL